MHRLDPVQMLQQPDRRVHRRRGVHLREPRRQIGGEPSQLLAWAFWRALNVFRHHGPPHPSSPRARGLYDLAWCENHKRSVVSACAGADRAGCEKTTDAVIGFSAWAARFPGHMTWCQDTFSKVASNLSFT